MNIQDKDKMEMPKTSCLFMILEKEDYSQRGKANVMHGDEM